MLSQKLSRTPLLAALLALSLSHMANADDGMPAAYQGSPAAPATQASPPAALTNDGFGSKVRGVFSATGEVFKQTAKATGNVIKGSVKATGEIIAGSARATGDVLVGSAKATEDILKGTAKAGEAACVATEDAIKGPTKAAPPVATSKATSTTSDTKSNLAKANEITTGAVAGPTESKLDKRKKSSTPSAIAASGADAIINTPYTPEAQAATPVIEPARYAPEAKAAKQVAAKAGEKAPLPHKKEALARSAPVAVPQQTVPSQAAAASLSTDGTRIAPGSGEPSESPSWNVQEPASSSTAFASQYALRTTPLQATPQ
jgi:hypothetical protein